MRLDSKAFFLEGGKQGGILEGQGGGMTGFCQVLVLCFMVRIGKINIF